jgi:hypothetical protein
VDPDLRGERGFAGIGEIMLLDEPASQDSALPTGESDPVTSESWQAAHAAAKRFVNQGIHESAQISTDVNATWYRTVPTDPDSLERDVDVVASDVEEHNLLFAGSSNLVTTRSDMFTVYFRVRSFRQNPTTLVWNAMDPEHILDDSRYVMLVDRSAVNGPGDKPKILYLEKLPN